MYPRIGIDWDFDKNTVRKKQYFFDGKYCFSLFFIRFSDVEHGAATTSESKSIKMMRFAIS